MYQGKYVFAQVVAWITRHEFNHCVAQYGGMHRVRRFSCWEQFLALAFGQLTYRESLRDVVVCLDAHRERLYHLGIQSPIVLSTIARANERRDWRIWADLAAVLIARARPLYADDSSFTLDMDGAVYLVDATTIDLCLSVFPWAHFRTTKSAVKLNLQMDVRGNIPVFFDITKGNVHDVHFLDKIEYEIGAHYIFDRGYTDFERLSAIDQAGSFFVIRAKKNIACRRVYSHSVDKTTGLRCDQIIRLTGISTAMAYPKHLRRVAYYDAETDHRYVFLTNDMTTDALAITILYKYRWQVELFFKWIKQHLRIKAFWGYSANAVKTQLCIAICTYLLVAIMKKDMGIERSLYEILQILSVTPFEKIPLNQLFSERGIQKLNGDAQKQLILLDF